MKKYLTLLSKDQISQISILFILMLLSVLFELLSIGIILPFLTILVEDDIYSAYPFLKPYLEIIGNPDKRQLIYYSCITLVGIFIVKNLYIGFVQWLQIKLTFKIYKELSANFFFHYLHMPYDFHINKKSAELINISETLVLSFSTNFIVLFLNLIIEILIIILIIILLIYFEPIITIGIASIFLFSGAIYLKIFKKRTRYWGKQIIDISNKRLQLLQMSFSGIKDIIINQKQNFYHNFYKTQVSDLADVRRKSATVQIFPRLFFEVIAVFSLSLLLIFLFETYENPKAFIPLIGLFAASTFRIMPSTTRIIFSSQRIINLLPSLDVLVKEKSTFISIQKHTFGPEIIFEKNIKLKNLSFTHESKQKKILEDVNLIINQGDHIGIVGGSGAGKTTLVNLITGILKPSSGIVEVDNIDIKKNTYSWYFSIGYVDQHVYLIDDSLEKNIAFGITDRDVNKDKILEVIKSVNLTPWVDVLPHGINTMVGEYGAKVSEGQRQRIGIARALYKNPKLLILDEVTSALDSKNEEQIMYNIHNNFDTKTILIISHKINTIKYCKKVYKLENKKLILEKK